MSISVSPLSDGAKKSNLQHRQTYYSKTQANFFKAYARQIEFVNRLNTLMAAIEKRKLIKITEEVKTCNKAFRKYLNERRIVHLKIDDVIAFQETYEKTNFTSTQSSSNSSIEELKRSLLPTLTLQERKKESRLSNFNSMSPKMFTSRQSKQQIISPIEREMVKKGFMTLLQKLETLKKDEFTNETKYLEGVLIRQCHKLKDYYAGMDENGWRGPRKSYNPNKMSVVEEIENEQKINGLYPIIMKNIREETCAIQKAEKTFETLMNS